MLGIVQGATEFVPVSSSAHLVLVPWAFGWPNLGLAFDTVLHVGTLLAVVAVFWRDLLAMASAWLASLPGVFALVRSLLDRSDGLDAKTPSALTPMARLAWCILLATIPAGLMGLLWEDQFEALFSSPLWVAVFLLVTGVWLFAVERQAHGAREAENLSLRQALLIGFAQGCSIAPGISRSGATIGAGSLLGLRRDAAARFSFLLSTPIILAAGLLQARRLLEAGGLDAGFWTMLAGFLAAFVSGLLCIRWLLTLLRRHGLTAFAVYCWVVGLLSIALYAAR